MLPHEIEEKMEEALVKGDKVNYFTPVSKNFKDKFNDFVQTNLVREIQRVRESFGLGLKPNKN
jgi:hypothetical protein